MRLRDFYPSYLVFVGAACEHYRNTWFAWIIIALGLIGWACYFDPKLKENQDADNNS